MSHEITWYPAAHDLMHAHEIEAIEKGLPKCGHDLADDEKGPRTSCSIGELFAHADGSVVIVTHDGHHRIVGELRPVGPPSERDLGEAPIVAHDHSHAHDEPDANLEHRAMAAEYERDAANLELAKTKDRLAFLEAKMNELIAAHSKTEPDKE